MHHAWLLTGSKGIGKGSFARAAALRLLAESSQRGTTGEGLSVDDDHPTAHLFRAGSHPDFILLERLIKEKSEERARSISVDQVRSLAGRFATTPSQSSRRIVVIDAVDDLERSAANALLKNLEEPPADTIFLLVSHAAGRLLPTIRSRCTNLRFSELDDAAMTSVLRENLPESAADELASLVRVGEGAPGKALGFVGLDIVGIDAALTRIAETGDPSGALRTELARKLALKAAQRRYEAFLARVPAFIAEQARTTEGDARGHFIGQWEAARSLANSAVHLSLDAHSTVFALAGRVAALAPPV